MLKTTVESQLSAQAARGFLNGSDARHRAGRVTPCRVSQVAGQRGLSGGSGSAATGIEHLKTHRLCYLRRWLSGNTGDSGKMNKAERQNSSAYRHSQKSIQRPDIGVEAQFPNKKAPKTYRYNSSLAPELCWDESAERPFAEWLLNLVAEAAEMGEAGVFAHPQIWEGTQEKFSSLSQCAARRGASASRS